MPNLFRVIFIATLSVAISFSAVAQSGYRASCWVISGLQGATFLQNDSYAPAHTTIDTPITLQLNGTESSISTPDMEVRQVDDFMAMVYSASLSTTNFEVFQIDPSVGIALMTKNMRVQGALSPISGITALVGKATTCD